MNLFELDFKSVLNKAFCALFLLSPFWALAQEDSLQYSLNNQNGGLFLNTPVQYTSEYDPFTGNYILRQQVGSISF